MSQPKKIAEVTEEEWAVQYRSYLGGRFDRTVIQDSEARARAQVERFNTKAKKGADCRLAHRYVTPWRPA